MYTSVADLPPASQLLFSNCTWTSKFLEVCCRLEYPARGDPPTAYSGQTGETPWGGSEDHLALGVLAHRSCGGQPVPCHLLSAVMPDHVFGISCCPFYLLFIEVNKQLTTCLQLYSHICTVCTVCTFIQYKHSPVFTSTAVT